MRFVTLLLLGLIAFTDETTAVKIAAAPKDDVDHSAEFFKAIESSEDGGTGYKRALPARFTGDGANDDLFMKSILTKWALEGKNKDGSPNGKFFMDQAGCTTVAKEVFTNNLGWKAAEIDAHLKTYFERAWKHFDVWLVGRINAEETPQFLRFLAGVPYIEGMHAQKEKAAEEAMLDKMAVLKLNQK